VAGGGSQGTSGTRGRWKAAGGKLTITLDSGDTAEYNYESSPIPQAGRFSACIQPTAASCRMEQEMTAGGG